MTIPSPPVCFDEMLVGIKDLLEESPRLKKMALNELYDHVCWYWNHGTVSWANVPKGGWNYTGFCLIKIIDDLRDIDVPYVHYPNGKFIFIEEVVAKEPDAWRQLFEMLYEIWGPREFMIWDRRERTEKVCPRIYSWVQYLKILKRLTHGYSP